MENCSCLRWCVILYFKYFPAWWMFSPLKKTLSVCHAAREVELRGRMHNCTSQYHSYRGISGFESWEKTAVDNLGTSFEKLKTVAFARPNRMLWLNSNLKFENNEKKKNYTVILFCYQFRLFTVVYQPKMWHWRVCYRELWPMTEYFRVGWFYNQCWVICVVMSVLYVHNKLFLLKLV